MLYFVFLRKSLNMRQVLCGVFVYSAADAEVTSKSILLQLSWLLLEYFVFPAGTGPYSCEKMAQC